MSTASVEELRKDVAELQSLQAQSTRARVKDALLLAIRKIETEITSKEELAKKQNSANGDAVKPEVKKPVPSATRRYTKEITTYAWDQSDKFMKIYVTLAGVQSIDKQNIKEEFTNSSFRVHVENLNNVNYSCSVGYLWDEIVPEKSYIKVKTDTILLMLKKKKESTTWAYVTKKDTKPKEKERKPDLSDDKDPQAGLMDLMKKMYDDGDDEMKRTIAKAWTESQEKKMRGEDMPL